MKKLFLVLLPLIAFATAAAYFFTQFFQNGFSDEEVVQYFGAPKGARDAPVSIYHLGHSLIGRDMPYMLEQLGEPGHAHASQLGGYATLQSHWEPDIPVPGFEKANKHAAFRDPKEALQSGTFDALVLTERVDLKTTIRDAKTPEYVVKWADLAWQANPDADVYLYETWFFLTTRWGWQRLIDWDLERYWEAGIADPAIRETERAIYMIPAGTVMSAFIREAQARGGVGGISEPEDLFQDHIHFNDFGAYLVALTHYAVIYRKSPVGLPHDLMKADSTKMQPLAPEAAALMQEIVWKVVTSYPRTGVSGS